MKKYKVINFLENKKNSKSKNINKVIAILVSMYIITDLFIEINKLKDLEEYVENNSYEISEDTKTTQLNHIDMNNIKRTYDKIGRQNISTFLVNNSMVEIEGKCQDLSILDQIEDEYIEEVSINKIKKEGEAYIFNISYVMFDKITAK